VSITGDRPIKIEQAFTVAASSDIIPVWMDFDTAYNISAEVTSSQYVSGKTNKTIELFLVENTALTQKQVFQLTNDFYVAVVLDRNNRALAFGLERGLKFVSSSQELTSTETHGGILVTMAESFVNVPMVFASPNPIVPLEGVTSITIGVEVAVGATALIEDYTFIPSDASVQTIVPVSSDELIFTCEETGQGTLTVTGVSVGQSTLTVYSLDGNYKIQEVSIEVVPA
jgi:hypothetical protein